MLARRRLPQNALKCFTLMVFVNLPSEWAAIKLSIWKGSGLDCKGYPGTKTL
jgi:hypothetical protein